MRWQRWWQRLWGGRPEAQRPFALATRADVQACYRLLLKRQPQRVLINRLEETSPKLIDYLDCAPNDRFRELFVLHRVPSANCLLISSKKESKPWIIVEHASTGWTGLVARPLAKHPVYPGYRCYPA